MTVPSIRSLLFVPGDGETKMLKALSSEADAVIIDLEDAVAPERKGYARELTRDLLSHADRGGKPVFVRLNAFDTGMTAVDLAAVISGRPWGVVLPKCAGPDELERLSSYLEALEARDSIESGSTRICSVATETAAATLKLSCPDTSAAHRLWGLLWGGEDLSATLGALSNRDDTGGYTFPYQFARSQCLYAANALGVQAVDAVYPDFRDLEGLEQETRVALRDGFTAKAAIHPHQVAVINQLMTPTPDQVEWAHQIMALLADTGVARLEGKMVDLAHKRIAERIIVRAKATGVSR
ncbi:(3S)-malyl-CoA thioesterase [Pseudomonas fluorescens]|uniref:HpcH/HpaI aldolase/citrate lyase family protein n=1 Tax=Pseudomonas fluorescens TaxID=294 RepID=UPI0012579B4D|nr:CoA ester lyase [Pseudomonas fluorescens]VVN70562.1 (3S)-malyl-CoA thioesterase [Pseudomonas fluorescens]